MSSQAPFDLRFVSFEGRAVPRAARGARRGLDHGELSDGGRPSSDEPAGGLARFVLHRAGLESRDYRGKPLERRTAACLRVLRCRDESEALVRLQAAPDRCEAALSALLIGVTEPFRDEEVFDAIGSQVLPSLRASGRPLRAWSAGCANGAELLSLAALLADAGLIERSELVGSDCRAEAIAEASAAMVPFAAWPERFRPLRERWFERAGDAWRPAAPLRRRIAWRQADFLRAVEPGPWDLVLWRNVAIYLTPAASSAVAQRIADALAPGGWLVVGKAERLPAARLGLQPIQRCLYRKPRRPA